jgi:hypothetical protein
MPDRLPPPLPQPAPQHLRDRIARELDAAPARRVRPRVVLIPLVAASLVAVVMIGAGLVGAHLAPNPVQSASPYSASASPTAARSDATPSVTPTPAPPASLNVRAMTKAEIAKDTAACLRSDPLLPRRGTPRPRWAMVQHRAGLAGPLGPVRVLIIQDDLNLWLCEDGDLRAEEAGDLRARWSGPAADTNVSGGTSGICGRGSAKLVSVAMYAVDNSVAFGQIRLVHHGIPGPWQSSQPTHGFVHLGFALEDHDAFLRSVRMQIQFVSKTGRILRFNPDNQPGQRIATFERGVKTCAHYPVRKPVKRPANDAAGIKTCAASARVYARSHSVTLGSRLRPLSVVSTPDE